MARSSKNREKTSSRKRRASRTKGRRQAAAVSATPPQPPIATPAAAPAPSRFRDDNHKRREMLLVERGVTKQQIKRALEAEGIALTHQTVSNVIAGDHRNADVERVFCTLTGAIASDAFPAKVSA